jgi:hypothetical protein
MLFDRAYFASRRAAERDIIAIKQIEKFTRLSENAPANR